MASIIPFYRPNGRDERPPFAHALQRGFAVVPAMDFVEVRGGFFATLYGTLGEPASMYIDPETALTVVRWISDHTEVYAAELSSGYVIYERAGEKAASCS